VNNIVAKDTHPLWRQVVSAVRTEPLTVLWRVLVVGVLLGLVFLVGRLSVRKTIPISTIEEGGSAKARQDNEDYITASKSPGDVRGVETGPVGTMNELRGELSPLIARNHDEIEELRRRGYREYDEFTLTVGTGPQKVGVVQVEVRETNPKKNQFTIDILEGDGTLEQRNRSANEPIYFFTEGSRVPLELVVNKVTKTTVSGYLSSSKALAGGP